MCSRTCLEFVRSSLRQDEVEGRAVLDVGARDINGSARPILVGLGCASYLGVDIVDGRGVDEICDASELVSRYGPCSFDVVVSTEALEHAFDWQAMVRNMKAVLVPGGILIMTTRSKGYPIHCRPDYCRFEISDMERIWSDFEIQRLESDPARPGVFVKAVKPLHFEEP